VKLRPSRPEYQNANRPVRTPSSCPPGVAGKGYIFRAEKRASEFYAGILTQGA
jgi:hypothetical protein